MEKAYWTNKSVKQCYLGSNGSTDIGIMMLD